MKKAKPSHGFTIIELVIVLVVVGIVGSVVGIRMAGHNATINLDRAARYLLSDVRYAQEMAMSNNRQVDFNLSSSTYSLSWDDGSAVSSTFGRGSIEGDLSEFGASISGSSFSFSRLGLPSGAVTLTINTSAGSAAITINAATGYSEISY